jgi:two-component system, NarL family, sensor histidine kinase DesK
MNRPRFHALRQYAGLFFAFAWLLFLAFPVAFLISGRHSPAVLAGSLVGVGGFAAVYAWLWLRPCRLQLVDGATVAVSGLTVLATLMTVADGGLWGSMYIYCATAAAFGLPVRRAVIWIAGQTALVIAVAAFDLAPNWVIVTSAGETLLIGLSAIGINSLVTANAELRAAREAIGRLAVSEERLRFARDLHDLLGHSLSVVVLKAELATRLAAGNPERAAAEMADVERVARQALHEVREAVAGYRQPSLSQELASAREVLSAAGIECRYRSEAGPLSPSLEGILGWAVREGVTNVARHSGARSCTLTVSRGDARVRLLVMDDGRGTIQPPQQGSGLRGLAERVDARGGSVTTDSDGDGFRLTVTIPLREASMEMAPAAPVR